MSPCGRRPFAGKHDDPGWVCIDETAGTVVALVGLSGWPWVVALVVERLADIFKVLPESPPQNGFPGQWGSQPMTSWRACMASPPDGIVGSTVTDGAPVDIRRRLTGVLFTGVSIGRTGYIAAVTVTTLVAEDMLGSATLAGLPGAVSVLVPRQAMFARLTIWRSVWSWALRLRHLM